MPGWCAVAKTSPPADGHDVRPPRWRPWHGKPSRRDLACALAIVVSLVYAVAAIPLTPALIATKPILLELLTGSNSSIVAAGAFSSTNNKFGLAVVVAAALPGLMRFDWVYWWAGRLWGHRIVERLGRPSPRAARLAGLAERRGTRFAGPAVLVAAFLPFAGTPVYATAGWVGLPLLQFVIFDTIGNAAWAAMLAAFGDGLGSSGVALANLVSRYALISIAVLVVLFIAPHAWQASRYRRRAARAPASAPQMLARENDEAGA